MSRMCLPITTSCVIGQIELLNKDSSVIKENLFNWVVEMDQFEFSRLCAEIISVYEFWRKYKNVRVSDDRDVLLPYIDALPKVEIILKPAPLNYSQKHFYLWLEEVNEFTLQDICLELEMLWDQAVENINSYVIDSIFPAVKNHCEWWQLNCGAIEQFMEVKQMLMVCTGNPAIPA